MTKLICKAVTFFICFLTPWQINAQHRITGRIIEDIETKKPLENANIGLITKDSMFVAGTISNEDGRFMLENIPTGNYMIIASYIGYNTQTLQLDKIRQSIDLEDILMEENTGQLSEITILASNVINRSDRSIIFVTKEQKAHATNGINLLTSMKLPQLVVNPLTNSISMAGDGKIQFCIEGVKVDETDIQALEPDEILRVEYINNPSLRYGNVDLVINYLLKRKVSGSAIQLDLVNALNTIFGNNRISGKVNNKNSQFGFYYSLRSRNPTKLQVNETRTFVFVDGTQYSHISEYYLANLKELYHNLNLNYNLVNKDDYFSATIRSSSINDDKKRGILQHTTVDDSETDVHKRFDSKVNSPSLDLYYSKSLTNKQTLILNLVGTYIHSDISQDYKEFLNESPKTNLVSNINGSKYSLITEGIYEKEFSQSNRFTAGFKYMNAYTKNEYTGTENSFTKMNQNDLYGYIEYSGKWKKIYYIAGVGLSFSQNQQKGEDKYSDYTFRPKLTLQYNFNPSTFLRLKSEVSSIPPSLANISAVEQFIDTLQITMGNPTLKPYKNYKSELSFSTKLGILNTYLNTSYQYNPRMIMGEVRRENNKFIHTFDNQKNWQKINGELTLSANIIENYLQLSLTGGVNRYMSNGNTYSHTHTNFYYRGQAIGTYKRFSAVIYAQSEYDRLYGEILNGGELYQDFMISYNADKFSLGAGLLCPFKHWRLYEGKNSYVPFVNKSFAKDYTNMFMVKFSWNFNSGHKGKDVRKRTNNEDMDSGIIHPN